MQRALILTEAGARNEVWRAWKSGTPGSLIMDNQSAQFRAGITRGYSGQATGINPKCEDAGGL